MKRIYTVITTLIIMIAPTFSFGDSVRISQIDSTRLLINQQIKLYVSVTDDRGNPVIELGRDNFTVYESPDGDSFQEIKKLSGFSSDINSTSGVNFLLLVDNSESMYWTMEGEKTDEETNRRMYIAKQAIRSFLTSISNPRDKVAVATYNTYYTLLSTPGNDISKIEEALGDIERPTGDAIYSEIYGSLDLSIDEFVTLKGRKAIIILSDGVNNPAFDHTKELNPQFGKKYVPFSQPLEHLQLEGISLYVIYFGARSDKKDRHLKTIARESGGVTFDAHNRDELRKVYFNIMNQIQKEVVLQYPATMEPADRKFVKVTYDKSGRQDSVTRYYLSSTVFGKPGETFTPFMIIAFLLACILLWLVSRIKFERQRQQPSIEILNTGAGKALTRVVTLGGGETVIGSSPSADFTIAGLPDVQENHATIVFDDTSKRYALKGSGKLLVNNQVVTTKILEPGDVINIDGMTMVFDEGLNQENQESEK